MGQVNRSCAKACDPQIERNVAIGPKAQVAARSRITDVPLCVALRAAKVPNLGMRGEITFVAMRDIAAGEELTHDWATTDDDDYTLQCNCGSANCRGTLTGKDWQRPDLQERYDGYFSAYLAEKIRNSK